LQHAGQSSISAQRKGSGGSPQHVLRVGLARNLDEKLKLGKYQILLLTPLVSTKLGQSHLCKLGQQRSRPGKTRKLRKQLLKHG
jgi:hypothetical protein